MKNNRCKYIFILILIGIASGLIGGFLGTGGGILLVFAQRRLYRKKADPLGGSTLSAKDIFASTVLCILPMSFLSAALYFQNKAFDLRSSLPYFIAAIPGGFCGAFVLDRFHTSVIKKIFAFILIYSGISMITGGLRS